MIFFFFFGLIELIGILVLYGIFHKFVISKYRRKSYKINSETNILITGAAFGIVLIKL